MNDDLRAFRAILAWSCVGLVLGVVALAAILWVVEGRS